MPSSHGCHSHDREPPVLDRHQTNLLFLALLCHEAYEGTGFHVAVVDGH